MRLYLCNEGHLYAKCLLDILIIYLKFHLLHFFDRGIRMQIPILTGVQNGRISRRKDSVFLLKKMLFLKLLFLDEGHLYTNYLFYILTIYRKCFLFHFLRCGIRMHIPIWISVQNGRISRRKDSVFLLKKMLFLKLLFLDEGHLYTNYLFYILTIYRKCFLFHFLRCGIRMHIPIWISVQNGRISRQNNRHILLNKCTF